MDCFSKMCCAAQGAADQAGEVISSAAADAYGKAKGAADGFALAKLKEAMEGSKVQEWEGPDVWFEIKEVELGEGVGAETSLLISTTSGKEFRQTSLLNFSLKGVKMKVRVEIVGTAAQLAGMVTADGAKKAAEKIGNAESALEEKFGLPSLGIGAYVAGAAASAKEKLSNAAKASNSSGVETKASEFDLVVDLEKVLGVEEIKSKVTIVGSSSLSNSVAITKYIGNGDLQLYAEDAISKRVTTIITDWQNKTVEKAKTEVAEAVERAKGKAVELAAAADELAKAKGLKK